MSLSALKQFYAQLSGDVNVAAICKKAAEGQFDFYFPAPASRSDDDILDAINSAMGNIINVVTTPYIVLKTQLDTRRAENVGALTSEGMRKTIADSRVWKNDEQGPRPEYAYARSAEDEYDTYENKLVKTLIDRLNDFIGRPLEETRGGIKSMYDVMNSRRSLNKFDMVRLTDFKALAECDAECFSQYKKLFYLRAKLRQLKSSAFYKIMSRLAPFTDAVPQPTNLLVHNADYNACMKLWLLISDARKKQDELTREQTKAAYASFVFLYAAYTLSQSGYEITSGRLHPDGDAVCGDAVAQSKWLTVTMRCDAESIAFDVKSNVSPVCRSTRAGLVTSDGGGKEYDYFISMLPTVCTDKTIYAFPDSRWSLNDLQTLVGCLVMVVDVAEDVYEKLCVVCGDNAVTQNEGVFCCGSCGAQYVFLAPNVLWICRFAPEKE